MLRSGRNCRILHWIIFISKAKLFQASDDESLMLNLTWSPRSMGANASHVHFGLLGLPRGHNRSWTPVASLQAHVPITGHALVNISALREQFNNSNGTQHLFDQWEQQYSRVELIAIPELQGTLKNISGKYKHISGKGFCNVQNPKNWAFNCVRYMEYSSIHSDFLDKFTFNSHIFQVFRYIRFST